MRARSNDKTIYLKPKYSFFASFNFKGDVVGLVMENRLDYCCYWLGLSYIGVIPALVNHNLRQQALLHTLTVAKCRAVIFSQLQSPGLAEVAHKVKRR